MSELRVAGTLVSPWSMPAHFCERSLLCSCDLLGQFSLLFFFGVPGTLSASPAPPRTLFAPVASYGSLARFKRLTRMHVASPNCILGVGGDYSDFQQLQTMVDAEMTAQYVANDGLSLSPKYVNYRRRAGVRCRRSLAVLVRLLLPAALCSKTGGSVCPSALRRCGHRPFWRRWQIFLVGPPSDR